MNAQSVTVPHPAAHRYEVTAGGVPVYRDEPPSLHAGIVHCRSSDLYEVWAFGVVIVEYTRRALVESPWPLFDSLCQAATEKDPRLRSLKCATVALPGMEDVGGWDWIECPDHSHGIRYLLPRGVSPPVGGSQLKPSLPQAEAELRRAVVVGWTFKVARAEEIRTVYYTHAKPVTST